MDKKLLVELRWFCDFREECYMVKENIGIEEALFFAKATAIRKVTEKSYDVTAMILLFASKELARNEPERKYLENECRKMIEKIINPIAEK